MSDFLEEVSLRTRQRVDSEMRNVSLADLKKRAASRAPARSLKSALRKPLAVSVIAELKQASPSAGLIRQEANFDHRILSYEKGGAAALSILTEEHYFHGSPHLLERAAPLVNIPVLRKDFIIDPYQIWETRCLGGDALLLIVALLPSKRLNEFLESTSEAGLEALVEVHDERELDHALEAGAPIIGINNRNLHTLRVDTDTSKRLAPRVPASAHRIVVVESGVREPRELPEMRRWGVQAVLIGETLMRSGEPEATVRSFVEAGRSQA